nr:MAG TPA: hypothetical protein [Caudoviricetes sp.]
MNLSSQKNIDERKWKSRDKVYSTKTWMIIRIIL